MTEIIKENINFSIKNETETLVAEGNCMITKENLIDSLYLNFRDKQGNNLGSANYRQDSRISSYSYQITDESTKTEISNLTDVIIQDVKTNMSTLNI